MSEVHTPNELYEPLLGLHALNPFSQHNTSPRNAMFASHFSQKLTLLKGDEKRIQSGAEEQFSHYTYAVRMPATGKIIQILDLYQRTLTSDIGDTPERYVIYEDIKTYEIGVLVIPRFISYHQYFGFPLVPTKHYARLVPGNIIEKDTVLLDSPAVVEEGSYRYGVELNVAMMTHPATSEDGFVISEAALEKLAFNVYERRVVEFGRTEYPLNLYGDAQHYKPFPDIGEYINEDGLLMVLRKFDENLAPVDMSIMDVKEPDFIFDKTIYARAGRGKVISIKMYHKEQSSSPTPSKMMDQADKYSKALEQFYRNLLEIEHRLRTEYRRKYGHDKMPIKPEFHQLIVEAMVYLDHPIRGGKQPPLQWEYRKTPLDDYRIEFVIEYTMLPVKGSKLTCLNGGKGVICKIEKTENMPVDEEGNRADLIIDPTSVVSRTNLGKLFEHYLDAAARDVTRRVRRMLGLEPMRQHHALKAIKALDAQDPQRVASAYEYLLGFYRIISDEQYDFFARRSHEEQLEHLADIVDQGVYLFYPTHNQKEDVDIIKEVQKHYPPVYGPVTYVGNSGQRVTTKKPVRIAPLYIMLLEKIADDWSCVNSGKLQHLGLLAPITKPEKHHKPWHNSPVRNIGETEARIYAGYCGREAIAEMLDRNNNPIAHKAIVKKILSEEKPTAIKEAVDRSLIPLGGSKALQLFKHIAVCEGWRPKYVKSR